MKKSYILLLFTLLYSFTTTAQEINLVKDAINGYEKENLGQGVNSEADEILPIISADGMSLYIVRSGHEENYGSSGADDAWFSSYENGVWSEAKNVGKPINNTSHNGIIGVSPDGNTLYIANTYNEDGSFKSVGVSVSQRTSSGWTLPKEIIIENFYNNASGFNNYCFSPNRKYMLMTIERDDTYGEQDLYLSVMQSDGTYTEPKNMGTVLNSDDTECAPFLAADGKTLYYTSMGKPGYGGGDIFVTRRLDDSWTKWSEPENLGPEINSESFDGFFTIPASGEYAYMASRQNSYGKGDIFRIKIAEAAKPEATVIISGIVYDKNTKQPLGAEISYRNSKGEEIGIATSSPEDGSYSLVVSLGDKYQLEPILAEYQGEITQVDVSKIKEFRIIEQDLYLYTGGMSDPVIPSNTDVVAKPEIQSVYFAYDSHQLTPDAKNKLRGVVEYMGQNPSATVEIQGHTDNTGGKDYNDELSVKRAETVMYYLISTGLDAKRAKMVGFGFDKPAESNNTPAGRAKNRRVDFRVIN